MLSTFIISGVIAAAAVSAAAVNPSPTLRYVCPSADIRGSPLSGADYYQDEGMSFFYCGYSGSSNEYQICYYRSEDGQVEAASNLYSTTDVSSSTATAVLNCPNPASKGYLSRKRSVETPPPRPKVSREDLSPGMMNMRDTRERKPRRQ